MRYLALGLLLSLAACCCKTKTNDEERVLTFSADPMPVEEWPQVFKGTVAFICDPLPNGSRPFFVIETDIRHSGSLFFFFSLIDYDNPKWEADLGKDLVLGDFIFLEVDRPKEYPNRCIQWFEGTALGKDEKPRKAYAEGFFVYVKKNKIRKTYYP